MMILPALGLLLAQQQPVLVEQHAATTARLQAISVVSSDVVWASGAQGTFVRTTDGGTHWTVGAVPGADSLEFRDVEAFSADTAYLLSAGPGDRSRIYRTTDGGRNWELQFTNATPDAFFDCLGFWEHGRGLAISDAVNGVFVAVATDDGRHWAPIPAGSFPPAGPGEGMFAASGTCLTVRGGSLGWIGTGAGKTARVLRTTNAGTTWEAAGTPIVQSTPTAGIMSVLFFDDRHGMVLGGDLAVTDTLTDNVAVSSDGGTTWQLALGRPSFPGPVYGGAVVPGRDRTVVAVGPGGASWTEDGGVTWSLLNRGNYWSVGFGPGGMGWMVGPRGRITRVSLGTGR